MIKKKQEVIICCLLECVLMTQGEIISKGKTIGWFKDMKEYLHVKEDRRSQHDHQTK